MTRQLILNADDFGLTPGVNAAILRAHRQGILTSATLMANAASFDEAVSIALATPTLGVGCHLVLVGGRSVAPARDVESLVDREGNFPRSLGQFVARVSTGAIRSVHIERELRAQIEKILRAGISPSHFDTHKHTHVHPRVLNALGRVAREFRITAIRKPIERLRHAIASQSQPGQLLAASAARSVSLKFRSLSRKYGLRSPDNFLGLAATGFVSAVALRKLIETLPPGQTEIMLHPGINDAALAATGTRLLAQRELELAALLDPAVKRAVVAQGIQLITFRELR